MSIWQDALLDPIYASDIAVDATIIRTTGETHSVRAIDVTEGFTQPGIASLVDMQTKRPAATVRHQELVDNGLTDLNEYLYKAEIIINGKRWRVKSFMPLPLPAGLGELALMLTDEQAP